MILWHLADDQDFNPIWCPKCGRRTFRHSYQGHWYVCEQCGHQITCQCET
jgi:predicted RNA-binding Zn-ribbon protein involved in translation (DUF1610 family)